MYDHIGLKVKDLEAAVRFYTAALESLGHVLGSKDKTYAGIGPKDAPGLWLYAGGKSSGSGMHIAFRAQSRGGGPLSSSRTQSRRPRQRQARITRGLQPHLLRCIPPRPRRQ